MSDRLMIASPSRTDGEQVVDLVVVGGGCSGLRMALETARLGLRPVLLEREDFGGATTANSLPLVHSRVGDDRSIRRGPSAEAAREQAWFLEHFPDLVRPLACVMPLRGWFPIPPAVHRVTRRLMEFAAVKSIGAKLPPDYFMDQRQIAELLPEARRSAYRGAAVWHETAVLDPQRLTMELVHWAEQCGAACLNYAQAEEIVLCRGRVTGVLARDRGCNRLLEFRTGTVINCAGPWCGRLAAKWDADRRCLQNLCLAFNVWLDVPPPCADYAVAIAAAGWHGRTLLVVPLRRGVLVGTQLLPWTGGAASPNVPEHEVFRFISMLDRVLPSLRARMDKVLRVYASLVPVRRAGSTRRTWRGVFRDHGALGGPAGLFSVSGLSGESARLLAEQLLRGAALPKRRHDPHGLERPAPFSVPAAEQVAGARSRNSEVHARIRQLVRQESVMHLDDLVLRRTDWAGYPDLLDAIVHAVCVAMDWDQDRRIMEKARLALALRQSLSPWPKPATVPLRPASKTLLGHTAHL